MIVGWGSTSAPIRGAIELLEKDGASVSFLQTIYMNPFPAERVADLLGSAKRTAIVENNATAQLGDLIREQTGVKIEDRILKYSGRQWLVDELADQIRERL
jgi:2-oxoglutarate ferredoxin oxidoreductase subunit alpha